MSIFTKRKFRNGLLSVSVLLSALSYEASAQNAGENIRRNSRDNSPKSITVPENSGYKPADAPALFNQYLEMNPGTDQMVLANTTRNQMGVVIDRYFQHYKGVKIDRAAYTVYSKDGKVKFLTGNFYKTSPNMAITPTLTEGQAFAKALSHIGAQQYMWQDATEEKAYKEIMNDAGASYFPKGNLVFIEKLNSNNEWDGQLHLAYSFSIYAKKPLSRDLVYVDAATGEILHKKPQIIHTAATGTSLYSATVPMETGFVGGNYRLNDSTRGNGIFTYNCNNTTSYANNNFINALLNWTTPDAGIDAHWGAEMVYDYWMSQQGRNSFDNAGAAIRSYVHYDVNYNNAFWDGIRMTYGDGTGTGNGGFDPLTSIDVVAHEIGHAVCTYTSDLDYVAESGGMNEGFSDIWGAVIENWSNPFEADAEAKDPWRIGEEISNSALRSMSNPNAHGDPDTYQGTNWVSTTGPCNGGNDYCGVHSNSGVLNKWFYILTVGESGTNDIGNAYSVTGLGWTISALIAYQTEQALVNNSTFADARAASISVASALYGPCSPQTESVTNAWYAVGVGAAFVPCYPVIGFSNPTAGITEWNNSTACPSSTVVNLPVTINTAPTGGNATVTVSVIGGTAVNGLDYSLAGGSLTFAAGSTATQNVPITIFDNGAINDDKYVTLQLNLTGNGSNAQLSTVTDTIRVNIINQDNAPTAGSTNVLDIFTSNTTSNASSPFQSAYRRFRIQYLLTPAELIAEGVQPGVPISALAFNVTTKNSTFAYQSYTVSMANTSTNSFTGGFSTTPLTQVHSANFTTAVGWNTLPFSTNFTWDGTSNVLINICYTNPGVAGSNDICAGYQGATLTAYSRNTNTTGTLGCALTNVSNTSPARPIMRFTQTIPPTAIETTNASSRVWNVRANTEVYFYSTADSQLISGIRNMNNNLGCVTGSLTGAGNGFVPATFGGVNRSAKEFTITPTINGSTTTYIGTMYMTTTEMNGVDPSTLFLVKTNEPTDATIHMGNSTIVAPIVAANANFVSFSANFTGFSRYFLTDGPLPPPPPVITPATSTTFCQGGSVMLNGNTGFGLTYSWLLNGALIPGATTSSYLATAGGSYQYILTNSVGVSDTSAVTVVTVNPAPPAIATPTGPTSVCTGGSVTMNANTGTGYSYQWRLNTANIPGANSSTYTATGSGFYTVVVTSGGCSATSAQINVVVNSTPSAVAGSNSPVCTGSTLFLTANAVPGCTYSWTGPAGFTANIQNASLANVQSVNAGDYYLAVTNTSTGCVGYDTVSVTTQNGTPPVQPGSISGPTPICQNETGTYTIAPVLDATTYTWTLPNGWSGSSTDTFINATIGANSGNVTVTANNACGSSAPVSFAVTVNPAPATPGVIGSIVYCLNETPAQLTATGTNLLWYTVPTGGTGDVNAPTPTTIATGITPHYVSQSDGICESQRSIILVTVNPLPTISITQVGNALTASGSYPYYQWYLDGVLIVGAVNQVYVATQDGMYEVVASDINGCEGSASVTIATNSVAGTGDTQEPRFYPNPTTGMCWLELPQASAKTEVLITDVAGKIIERRMVENERKVAFDLSKLARGVYMVKVVTADKTYTSRVTLQ